MARFFLEKSAASGKREAQRKLGALLLRAAGTLVESEQAIHLLHQAAGQGDDHAAALLASLVLPLQGSESEARMAIESLRGTHPVLAARLRLSRDFGLTRLEALCVDPVAGLRPWGLVVGKNPFITKSRLSAPRAIPAITTSARENLHRVASLFSTAHSAGGIIEGDVRRRTLIQKRAFEQHGLDESMFFAAASSTTLDAMRQGPKWAFRTREPLQLALAA
jgi:TPR repeat protein